MKWAALALTLFLMGLVCPVSDSRTTEGFE